MCWQRCCRKASSSGSRKQVEQQTGAGRCTIKVPASCRVGFCHIWLAEFLYDWHASCTRPSLLLLLLQRVHTVAEVTTGPQARPGVTRPQEHSARALYAVHALYFNLMLLAAAHACSTRHHSHQSSCNEAASYRYVGRRVQNQFVNYNCSGIMIGHGRLGEVYMFRPQANLSRSLLTCLQTRAVTGKNTLKQLACAVLPCCET